MLQPFFGGDVALRVSQDLHKVDTGMYRNTWLGLCYGVDRDSNQDPILS